MPTKRKKPHLLAYFTLCVCRPGLGSAWAGSSDPGTCRKAVGVDPGIHASNYPDPNPDPDADPDPAIFITDLQDANKKRIF